ncbi:MULTISPECIES: 6-phosphogluconolactonase [Shimia]|uniref:6-phosphogluconolactonase n=1 Tax=Shimia TaxID=573139 RepID=UPI001FB44E1D|nr:MULTISPECIES: 6-phosphogluconolactonase [Shimia]MDV4144193.1 6-phosphogluconolactonase [Shimia sp. FJ5]
MKITPYSDRDMMAIDVANQIADELAEALHHEKRVCLAVPGGTTPGPVFDALCAADIDWARVDVVPTDERWVEEDSPRSNARLIKDRLLVDRAAKARFLPLYTPAHEPEEVLAELESMIAPELPLAVAILGMGDDMHTASLFPGADGLEEALAAKAPILVPIRRADLEETRLSLSARILDGALSKHVLITGAQKRNAIEAARHLPPQEAPIRVILQDAKIHWSE